mmetsp:Transcript_6078/g.6335  ORF Transcript_6078/g.6335 Transcript_6078/m.6335 type:complete len:818 (+) Transcript_6078:73-2526(+)
MINNLQVKSSFKYSSSSSLRNNSNNILKTMISILPPSNNIERLPIDICCVIDISGSMESLAPAPSQGIESCSLSVLDIVKHSVKTIITCLKDGDRLAIVSYSTYARIELELTNMNEEGKNIALEVLSRLRIEGSTNIWDGLLKGMETMSKRDSFERNSAIFLLTDGCPNVDPPKTYKESMRDYKDSHGGVYPGTISTFGFGYNLKSSLLKEIAIEGGGMYSFIPDSGFVGTSFVNALSNQLVCFGHESFLTIESRNGVKIIDDEDSSFSICQEINSQQDQAIVNVGSLQYGQDRHFILHISYPNDMSEVEISENIRCKLTYTPYYTSSESNIIIQNIVQNENKNVCFDYSWNQSCELLAEMEIQIFRNRLIHFLSTIIENVTTGVYEIPKTNENNNNNNNTPSNSLLANDLREWLRNHPKSRRGNSSNDIKYDRVNGIIGDLIGQITEALSKKEYFDKWGIHYLPSLQRSHELQQCTNFKDPGIQFYGGTLFQQVSKMGDEMFCTLPPPCSLSLPSPPPPPPQDKSTPLTLNYNAQDYYQCNYMSRFHSTSAPCFHDSCLVTMADGTKKKISEIKQGDYVICPSSTRIMKNVDKNNFIIVSQVESMLRTFTRFGVMEFVLFESGLLVTPWHPIKLNEKWTFPIETIQSNENENESEKENENKSKIVNKMTEAVYSFLLGSEIILNKSDLNDDKSNIIEILDEITKRRKERRRENKISEQDEEEVKDEEEMNRGQSMLINDIECITLAHGIKNDKVATHSFYGSEEVVNSMKKRISSFSLELKLKMKLELELSEYVDLYEGDVIKDSQTKLACGFKRK